MTSTGVRAGAAVVALAALTGTTIALSGGPGVVLLAIILLFAVVALVPRLTAQSAAFWWMNPSWTAIIATAPGLVAAVVLPGSYFLEQWDTPKFISMKYVWLVVGLVAALSIGAAVGRRLTAPGSADWVTRASSGQRERLERAARILFWVTVTGYVMWTLIGVARGLRPAAIGAILAGGGVASAKDLLTPVAGVTTLTQFGPVTVVCFVLLRRMGTEMRTARYLCVLFVLALFRTVVYAERLALLELVIPAVITMLIVPKKPFRRRAILTLLPLWAPVVLIIFFGSFEYFRSWSSPYYQSQYAGRSYADFTVTRIGAYYATAMNNGVLVLHNDERTSAVPFFALRGVWEFPVLGAAFPYPRFAGSDETKVYAAALTAQGNPEFNNQSGILLPAFDFGTVGAVAYWLIGGMFLGAIFQWFRNRDIAGLLAYPVMFIGLLEVGRILYWPLGRALPSIIFALVLGIRLRSERSPARTRQDGEVTGATARDLVPRTPHASGKLPNLDGRSF